MQYSPEPPTQQPNLGHVEKIKDGTKLPGAGNERIQAQARMAPVKHMSMEESTAATEMHAPAVHLPKSSKTAYLCAASFAIAAVETLNANAT
jgi:hypothetical protein